MIWSVVKRLSNAASHRLSPSVLPSHRPSPVAASAAASDAGECPFPGVLRSSMIAAFGSTGRGAACVVDDAGAGDIVVGVGDGVRLRTHRLKSSSGRGSDNTTTDGD